MWRFDPLELFIHLWWDHVHSVERQPQAKAIVLAPANRPALMRNFSRQYVDQWVQALKPQLLRESSALIMLKDALRTAPAAPTGVY